MMKTNTPIEVTNYMKTHYPTGVIQIFDIERYENIYAVSFTWENIHKTAYIPVSKAKRMSDSEGCG